MAKTVRDLFNDYMANSDRSQSAVARAIGISATSLSQWINKKYPGDFVKLEKRIEDFLSREFTRAKYKVHDNFIDTSLALSITDVLNYCHTHQDMGVVYGSPGLGKTISANEYKKAHPDTLLITAFKGFSWSAIISSICEDLGLASKLAGYRKVQMISNALKGSDRLIIIDEAQFLTDSSLEIVRSIHDLSGVGVVYIGQPSLERKMKGKEAEFFAQIYSRLGVKLTLSAPEFTDVQLIANSYGIRDERIIQYLWDVVINDRWGGSFRKMSKLLKLALRVSTTKDTEITIPFLKDVGRNMIYSA